MTCPCDANVKCDGPNGSKWWVCPVHGARLTRQWTELCRTDKRYREAWQQGRGPGQRRESIEQPREHPVKSRVANRILHRICRRCAKYPCLAPKTCSHENQIRGGRINCPDGLWFLV